MKRAIIGAAIAGGTTVPGQSAALPVTPEETVESDVGARGDGATTVRLRVRGPASGGPGSDVGLLREVFYGIRGRCDVIVQPTTGGEDRTPEESAETNATLVEVVALAAMLDREPAAPDEAREAFGLKGRSAVAL